MFTGREYDWETGNYYYRARYYSPKIGRFLQTDPIGYAGGLNLYTYVDNNPTNYVDPLGLWTEEMHRRLGQFGRGRGGAPFDYGRLDIEQPATNVFHPEWKERHFRNRTDAIEDALAAARRHDARAFELHVHEVQDYWAHTAAGYGPRRGHFWTHKPDYPAIPENRERYAQAAEDTRGLENYWNLHNPPPDAPPADTPQKPNKKQ